MKRAGDVPGGNTFKSPWWRAPRRWLGMMATTKGWRRKAGPASLALVIPIVWLACTAPATGQSVGTFTFDSGSCREDTQETVYVTLFGTVLRLPMDHLHRISALHPTNAHRVPPARDPAEPLGCPGNPLPGSVFVVSIPTPEGLTFSTSDAASTRFREGVIPVGRLAIRAARTDFFGTQESNQRRAQNTCEVGIVRVINEDLLECLIQSDNEIFTRDQWSGDYITDLTFYSMPFGGPFVVSCLLGRPVRDCRVSYKLYDTVNVTYHVDIRFIRPDQLVDVDQAIRQQLEAWRVPTRASEGP